MSLCTATGDFCKSHVGGCEPLLPGEEKVLKQHRYPAKTRSWAGGGKPQQSTRAAQPRLRRGSFPHTQFLDSCRSRPVLPRCSSEAIAGLGKQVPLVPGCSRNLHFAPAIHTHRRLDRSCSLEKPGSEGSRRSTDEWL